MSSRKNGFFWNKKFTRLLREMVDEMIDDEIYQQTADLSPGDILTLSKDVRVKASGGDALMVNYLSKVGSPEILMNDVVADTWVTLTPQTQVQYAGMYNNDVYLVIVSETGDFSDPSGTYGLVLRKASWQNLLDNAVVS